jgi:hypothetical protein
VRRDVGVVTPTHPARNYTGHLERAVASVATQAHQAERHCIYTDVHRLGAAYSRQQALLMNTCTWTAFLDSDDWFLPNHLAVLLQAAEETGADYVYSWFHLAYGPDRIMGDFDPVFPPTHFTEPWDPKRPRHTTITTLVRTELAKEVGFYTVPDDGEIAQRQGEDYEFTLRCNELGKIHHVAERTWVWNHHGQNSSGIAGRGDAR